MTESAWLPRDCPVCGNGRDRGIGFLERNWDPGRITALSYASRKDPEYMCFRLLRCPVCDLIYACESPSGESISSAYHQAGYDSSVEAQAAARSYLRAIHRHLDVLGHRGPALEIGAGTGAFLELLAGVGFRDLVGIEPSSAAIAAATPAARGWLREGIFTDGVFAAGSLSLICCFMTLEHVPDPRRLVAECHRLLRPGGMLALVTHDRSAWNNRLLGRKAPIIDIEHLQLFNPRSMRELMRRTGFTGVQVESFANTYRLAYWNRLLPWPRVLKRTFAAALDGTGLGRLSLRMNVGNILTVAVRPGAAG